jgi:acyl-CoA thioesterase
VADFELDTAVTPAGDGAFDCEIHPAWWVVMGPNGGYVAAIVVRALQATVAEGRPLRSLTVHYMRAPKEGPALIRTETVREGRSVSFLHATLHQGDRACAAAMAVFATDRGGVAFNTARPPDIPAPEDVAPQEGSRLEAPPFAQNFDFRPAIGGRPFEGAPEAVTGGWLWPKQGPEELDAALAVALCDSWFPALFTAVETPLAVPTLDLTVHLRAPLPRPADWVLGSFWTRRARDGFLEEDGELFSRDGELLAQSRQLALSV